MPRIGPGLMMSRINRYEADWPIWRHFIEGTECPGGEACPWGAAFSERAVWPEKATYGRLSSRKGGGLLYLILKRFACLNKYNHPPSGSRPGVAGLRQSRRLPATPGRITTTFRFPLQPSPPYIPIPFIYIYLYRSASVVLPALLAGRRCRDRRGAVSRGRDPLAHMYMYRIFSSHIFGTFFSMCL
jgi:hypothetical protein